MKTTKDKVLSALYAFVSQRSGMDSRNYGDRASLMGDYRPMLRHGKQARQMLRAIELRPSITAEQILSASRQAYSGRLSIVEKGESVEIDYCTGQYFPTEYRKAVCAVCAAVLWSYWRDSMPSEEIAKSPEACPQVARGLVNCSAYVRKQARRELGRSIASTWFN